MTPDAAPTARLRELIEALDDFCEAIIAADGANDHAWLIRHARDFKAEAAALSLGSAGPQWQPIETCWITSLPGHDRHPILVYGPEVGISRGYVIDYGDGTRHHAAEGFNGDWKITHWMPLPDPPAGSAGPPTQESQQLNESRSPDGDGLAVPRSMAARRPALTSMPSVAQQNGGHDNRVAGSEPADSHQSVAGASAGAVAPLDLDVIASEWAMRAMAYARQQVCPRYQNDEPGTPYERGLMNRIAGTYRDGYLAAIECVRMRLRKAEGTPSMAANDLARPKLNEQQRALFMAVEEVLNQHHAAFDDLCETYAVAFEDDGDEADELIRGLLYGAAESLRNAGMDWYVSTK